MMIPVGFAHATQLHRPGGVELVADRDSAPLSALTADHAVSQLVHRVIGPDGRDLVPVLEWARGGDPDEITAQYGMPPTALQRRLRVVRAAGARTPLRDAVVDELTAPDAHTEEHRRARRLFGLPTPPANLSRRLFWSTAAALRVLATLGPLPIDVLCEAVNRSRRRTSGLPSTTVSELQIGLRFRGATHDPAAGTWAAPAAAVPAARDRRLVEALRVSGPLTRVELNQLLLEVGYTARTPQSPIVDHNPLIRRTAPNRYELLCLASWLEVRGQLGRP